MQVDATKWAVWGLIRGISSTSKLYGLQEAARNIAEALEGDTPLEKLAHLEMGEENRILIDEEDMTLVVLKQCPFVKLYGHMPEWTEEDRELVKRFNAHPRGGSALHPLCLLHCYIRQSLGGIHNLACRSLSTGETAIAERLIEEIGLSKGRVEDLISGNACVYAFKKA